jgi:hypothetical protein
MSKRANGAVRMPGDENRAGSRQSTPADGQWAVVGQLVRRILRTMLVQQRQQFAAAARQRGCSLEQLTAAAITGAVREFVEDAGLHTARPR